MSSSLSQPGWRNPARAWGIFCLAALFGVGAFFLLRRSFADWADVVDQGTAGPAVLGIWYAVLALVGLAKGEIIFRRKVLARALARARAAVGATGNLADLPLAPLCMLSMYRPWKPAHAISSWVLLPLMVGLAFFFRFGLPALIGADAGALVRGPVYFGIGLALAYGALVYLAALARFVGWWLGGAAGAPPLPEPEIGLPRSGMGAPTVASL